jgi:hypothetical protein
MPLGGDDLSGACHVFLEPAIVPVFEQRGGSIFYEKVKSM